MRRVLAVVWIWMLLFEITVHAKGEEPEQLYAQSAVLMDADSGRVLFEKTVRNRRRWRVQQKS